MGLPELDTEVPTLDVLIVDPPWGKLEKPWDQLDLAFYSVIAALAKTFLSPTGVLLVLLPADRYVTQPLYTNQNVSN